MLSPSLHVERGWLGLSKLLLLLLSILYFFTFSKSPVRLQKPEFLILKDQHLPHFEYKTAFGGDVAVFEHHIFDRTVFQSVHIANRGSRSGDIDDFYVTKNR